MEKYIYDEKNGLWFELQGDYYLPCLKTARRRDNSLSVHAITNRCFCYTVFFCILNQGLPKPHGLCYLIHGE